MHLATAVRLLEANGLLDRDRSPNENSANMLLFALSHDLDEEIKALLVYILHVVKSDRRYAETPISLQRAQTWKDCESNEIQHSDVQDWLVSDFTDAKTNIRLARRRSLKAVAQGIKFTISLKTALNGPKNGDLYVYDALPSERERISVLLYSINSWEWDAWKLHAVSNGRPLQVLGWHLLHEWDLVKTLKLDRMVLRNFLTFVEAQYNNVPYHTATHAADVLHATHFILSQCGAARALSALAIFTVLVSAMIHDAGHDGLNNAFHQNALTDRALAFNDQSVQENYHCTTILSNIAKNNHLNILASLTPDQAKEARRLLVLMTLGTDMKHHFKHVQELTATIEEHGSDLTIWEASSAACDQLCVAVVHAADISNTCRDFPLARGWADRLMREFAAQGDRERALGLPVSPLCGKGTVLTSTSQVSRILISLPHFFLKSGCSFRAVDDRFILQCVHPAVYPAGKSAVSKGENAFKHCIWRQECLSRGHVRYTWPHLQRKPLAFPCVTCVALLTRVPRVPCVPRVSGAANPFTSNIRATPSAPNHFVESIRVDIYTLLSPPFPLPLKCRWAL
jgi:hypothetical protein